MDNFLQSLFARMVSRGALTIITARGTTLTFGDGTGEEVRVRFTDTRAELAAILDPHLYLGELFMDGRLIVERGTIYDFLELVLRETGGHNKVVPAHIINRIRHQTRRLFSRNNPRRSRHNVAHHYDLDRRLYRLFLDKDFQYSCAYFERPDCALEEAQLAKKRLVTAKLAVKPDSRVLDIGSGWGGLALYMKEIAGAREVLGVTLSTEQLSAARERARERGLDSDVNFELQDYRALKGTFDRIVSVGMFEHVGPRYYQTFFDKCQKLLAPDGVMLLHTIGHLDGPWDPNPWLEKYIFPGGHLPALSQIVSAIERSGLIVTDVECLRLHYAETLAEWRRRFMARRDEVLALYDEQFCRMWEFYLAACEASFRYGNLGVFQVQCAHGVDALPITRDYIAARISDLRTKEIRHGLTESLRGKVREAEVRPIIRRRRHG
ncbi:MAG: class I SAM-dependent methyltransferase [Hyphomicrobium sp.]